MQEAIDAVELLDDYPEGSEQSGCVPSVALNLGHPTHDAVARLIDRWPDGAPRQVRRRWRMLKDLSRLPNPDRVYLHRLARRLARCIQSLLMLPPAHSSDFRCVNWHGRLFQFTALQAVIIRLLWHEWERGVPFVSEAWLLTAAEHETDADRIQPLFHGHPAWLTMIVRGGKGTLGIAPKNSQPESQQPPSALNQSGPIEAM